MNLMGNLFVFFYEVQAFWKNGILLVLVFAHLHKDLNHVLHAVTDGSLIENGTEALKDGRICFWRVFRKESADFTRKANGNFDGVVGWTFEKQDQYLECDDLVRDGLVDEMCDESGS